MTDFSSSAGLIETCWKFLVLGAIQGLTEFLPISSTAHLKVLPILFGWGDPGVSVTAVLQLGSMFAVITYFWKDLYGMYKGMDLAIRRKQFHKPNARLAIAILLGTIPIAFAGTTIKWVWIDFDRSPIRSIPIIAGVSIAMGLLLALAEYCSNPKKIIQNIQPKDGVLVGFSQALALIPGVSRSGVTLTTSLLFGWRREDAARFSFLLGIPAITLAGLAEINEALQQQISNGIWPLIIGISSSIVVSWFAIDWLLRYLRHNKAWLFVGYRLIFGLSLIVWWLYGLPTKA